MKIDNIDVSKLTYFGTTDEKCKCFIYDDVLLMVSPSSIMIRELSNINIIKLNTSYIDLNTFEIKFKIFDENFNEYFKKIKIININQKDIFNIAKAEQRKRKIDGII